MLARNTASAAVAAALLAACTAAPPRALTDLPVDATQTVPPAAYAEAAKLAAGRATPVEIALAVTGPFEGRSQHIVQVNEGVEVPTGARVTVVRDGLLDDSLRGDRWDIRLERTQAGAWRIADVQRAWRCRRSGDPDRFVAARCL
jgi:hypothetical protein